MTVGIDNMAPTQREGVSAWSIYQNAGSFNGVLNDLLKPFEFDEGYLVATPGAMGFVLGCAMAVRLGTGFLALGKADWLPVYIDAATFTEHTGRNQSLKYARLPFFPVPLDITGGPVDRGG